MKNHRKNQQRSYIIAYVMVAAVVACLQFIGLSAYLGSGKTLEYIQETVDTRNSTTRHGDAIAAMFRAFPSKATAPPVMSSAERQDVFKEYAQLHRQIMNSTDTGVEKRVLVIHFHRHVYYGNRLGALVGAYLFAMASRRALLVDWVQTGVLKHPVTKEVAAHMNIKQVLQSPGFEWDIAAHKASWIRKLSRQRLNLFFGNGQLKDASMLMCSNITEKWRNVQMVVWHDMQDNFTPSLQLNAIDPAMGAWLWRVFGDHPFMLAARHLLRPVQEVQNKLQHFTRKLKQLPRPIVGLQLRIVHYNVSNPKADYMACVPKETKSLLLVTDYPPMALNVSRKWAKTHSPDTFFYANVSVDLKTLQGHYDALLELWLLSYTDTIIISGKSTYGGVAHSLGITPARVMHADGTCVRKPGTENIHWSFASSSTALLNCRGKQLYAPALYSTQLHGATICYSGCA